MEYKKKFNKDKTKVTITAPEGSGGLWDPEKEHWVDKKEYAVVDKEKLYKEIRLINKRSLVAPKGIDISCKYVKDFSLNEYRKKNKQENNKRIALKNFNAIGTFFDGEIDFSNVDFKGNHTSFGQTTFSDGNIFFNGATFKTGGVSFLNSNFGDGNISFAKANFGKGYVDFGNAIFGKGDINFRGVFFKEVGVDFIGTNFGKGNIDFSYSNFGERYVNFNYAILEEGHLIFRGIKISGDWDMRVEQAEVIDFSDSRIYGNIDFGFYEKKATGENHLVRISPQVKELRMINAKLYGKIHLDYDGFGLKEAIENQNTTHRQKADQFRLFKENFRRLGQYDDEDKAYVQFMYHKIRDEAEIEEKDTFWKRVTKRGVFWFKRLVFEKMGKYGTSPRNVAISMGIVVTIFSFLYAFLPPSNIDNAAPIFHSVITFLTIGYGTDFINLNFWGKLFSGIEGFMGLFLMSYFTISFVRKVLR